MKKDYTKEEIIDLLEFVEEKVHLYLQVVDDDNLDNWSLDITRDGEKVIGIYTSSYSHGDTDYCFHSVKIETLLSTTEEQLLILEDERNAEIERKRLERLKKEQEQKELREKEEYESYLKLKNKYEK